MQAVRSVDSFLTNMNLFSDYITDVLFIQPDSTVVYSMNDILRSGYDYVNAEWFLEASARDKPFVKYASPHGRDHMYENKGPYQTDCYGFLSGPPVGSAAGLYYDGVRFGQTDGFLFPQSRSPIPVLSFLTRITGLSWTIRRGGPGWNSLGESTF